MKNIKHISRRDLFAPTAGLAAAAALLPSLGRAAEAASSDEPVPIFSGIMQVCYIVPDLQKAMQEYADFMGIGPWSVTERFAPRDMMYRGQPTAPDITIGMSYSGQLNFELIQQRDETPSVYRDTLLKRGYGFHHWGVATDDFDGDLARYKERGIEAAFTMTLGGGYRLAYMDTTEHLDGMIELIEMNEGTRTSFTRMFRTAREWDGKTLISNSR
ncbi:MAG: VOC family protein [Pseudomonadales bacterium]|jgi:hypothetical protein|nr:VOC family protein [Pseudomonadales bacterium]